MKYQNRTFSVASGFGEGTKEKGRFVWDAQTKSLVRAEDYRPPDRALDAPVMVDRFYEGMKATDGTDIGSRAKYRDYLKARGVTSSSDFSPSWYENRRKEIAAEEKRDRRESIIQTYKEMRR